MIPLMEAPLPVSGRSQRLVVALVELPLASARDLGLVLGCRPSSLYKPLLELQDRGFVSSVTLGWTWERSRRWFLTDRALTIVGKLGVTWHEESPRCRLLERLPSVEWFYPVVGQLEGLGEFECFQWLEGLSFDAAVRYKGGWVALFWSGLLQTEGLIAERLAKFAHDIADLPSFGPSAWPGLLCFVVTDHWQRELVLRVSRRLALSDMVVVWCIADGTRSGVREPLPSRGWIYQPVYQHGLGGWSWERRVEAAVWSGRRGVSVSRVLDAVAQWPGITARLCKQILGEGLDDRTTEQCVKVLLERELVERTRSKEGYRYSISSKGLDRLCRRDRVRFGDYGSRVMASSWVELEQKREHEEGVLSLMGGFVGAGLSFAAGWRSWEHMGGGGGIAPDGLVNLRQSPYGPGWHYVEYERYARGRDRVGRKLKGYASSRRQDSWPVLFVCWSDAAEAVFHELGDELRLRLLTATLSRVKQHGPAGNFECWSSYGQPALVN